MAGFAKWITGGLGFVLGGPIGAIVGFALGSLIDSAAVRLSFGDDLQLDYQTYGNRNTAEGDFKMSLLVLIACVMKAD